MLNKIFNHLRKNHLAYLVIIFGLLGTMAAFYLLYDRIQIYEDPNYKLSCSINPWLDCGRVMLSKWASFFGFPNSMIGLISYPTAFFVGLFMLLNKNNNRYLMLFCMSLAGIGVFANVLLLYISSYLIMSLCPWCLLAGVCTTNIFYAILNYNILQNNFNFNPQKHQKLSKLIKNGYNVLPIIGFYLILATFVYVGFSLRKWGIYIDFWDPAPWS